MPKLNTGQTEQITLPSSKPEDPATVTLSTKVSAGQALALSEADDKRAGLGNLLASAIKSWNFVGEDGKTVPITNETVLQLEIEDFTFLVKKLTDGIDLALSESSIGTDEKKA